MMYSAVLLLYAILRQRDGVPKTGKGAEGHGARERLLTIHLMELLRKDGKYATKLGLEPSIITVDTGIIAHDIAYSFYEIR